MMDGGWLISDFRFQISDFIRGPDKGHAVVEKAHDWSD
jgi:hypothetical protein